MKNPKDNFIVERIRSIKFSLRGIWFLISTESSIKAQLFIVLLISIAGFYFNINTIEWLIQTIAIGLVLVAESLNTGIEKLADFVHPDYHKKNWIKKRRFCRLFRDCCNNFFNYCRNYIHS